MRVLAILVQMYLLIDCIDSTQVCGDQEWMWAGLMPSAGLTAQVVAYNKKSNKLAIGGSVSDGSQYGFWMSAKPSAFIMSKKKPDENDFYFGLVIQRFNPSMFDPIEISGVKALTYQNQDKGIGDKYLFGVFETEQSSDDTVVFFANDEKLSAQRIEGISDYCLRNKYSLFMYEKKSTVMALDPCPGSSLQKTLLLKMEGSTTLADDFITHVYELDQSSANRQDVTTDAIYAGDYKELDSTDMTSLAQTPIYWTGQGKQMVGGSYETHLFYAATAFATFTSA